jgi:nucleotide-binding universal stress UspA family protein
MSYKTILMHLNHDRRTPQLLDAGVQLAEAFGAHLIGLNVFPAYRLTPPMPMPIGRDVLGSITAQIREEIDRIKSKFAEATKQHTFLSEWRSVTSERADPASIVIDHGHATDLIIASQADPGWDLSSILDFPERLAIESGRPVLVIPNGWEFSALPRSITVAWKGRREAARATFDALPLLKRAERVQVITVEEDQRGEAGPPDTEIAAALDRHGVKVSLAKFPAIEASAGEEINRRASQHSELLVMGAYGQSRFREFVFGGVTRHILQNMKVPVLFSH